MIAEHIFLTTPKAPRSAADVPFPTLGFDPSSDWEWPKPPYASDDPRPPMVAAPEPCRLELVDGRVVEGELVALYPDRQELVFRRSTTEPTVTVKFALICRLSLKALWDVRRAAADSPAERFGPEMKVRGYMADFGGVRLINGQTMGVIERDFGWFLYEPIEEGRTIMRVFIPSAVCKELNFAKTTQEKAAELWVATPDELLAAIDAQAHAKVLPLGEALVDLGLISRSDVDRVLAQYSRNSDKPLGERLVDVGLLTRSDLQTALAHKMGYPIVDLMRFPIDINAVRKVPQRVLAEHRAMPLMLHGARLYVAVDDLQAVPHVQALRSLQGLKVVAVLAPQAALRLTLAGLTQRLGSDPWADNVSNYV